MKIIKIMLPVALIAALSLSWFSFVKGTYDLYKNYNDCVEEAKTSEQAGLYEQAVEHYKKSTEYYNTLNTYKSIQEIYEKLYAEEHTTFIRNLYIGDMEDASAEFPEHAFFWEKQIELHMEALNYSKAYSTVKRAMNFGAGSEELTRLYKTLLYMVKHDYKLYYDYKTALNGYISVFDGNVWTVIDENGDKIRSSYKLAGLLNDDGKGLYINEIDTRILDEDEITRARFDVVVDEAGYYNEKADLLPVKIGDHWRYMNSKGEFLEGQFEIAGSYYDGKAVAYTGQKWVLLDNKGNQTALKYEDIKLDLYGCHVQNGIIIAKENGKYHFYDMEYKQIGTFSADDTDICVDGSLIAFKSGEKWGYADQKGNIVIEPLYVNAKSFSNGYAAICNEAGQWGFLNDKYEIVIPCNYIDAFYFNSNETCLVSISENTVQLLHFMFE